MGDNEKKYLRNTRTSNSRTVRLEIIGDITEQERHFLDGIGLFVAGTMCKNDKKHTTYVAELMTKLMKDILAKLKSDNTGGE